MDEFEFTMPRQGDVLGNVWRLEDELGRGGFSVVFRATQLDLGRAAAVKVLQPEATWNIEARELFEREARFARNLNHPHIIDLYAYGHTGGGLPFIAMEFLRGQALREVLQRGTLSPAKLRRLVQQVLKALMASHQQGVVHRDIKPSNIFLCDFEGAEDFAKVIDFGIAKAVSQVGSEAFRTSHRVLGTPLYIAPEQIRSHGVGPHTDLYALGLVMAEALSGSTVYPKGLSVTELVRQHLAPGPTPLPMAALDSPLGAIIEKATRKDYKLRYASAWEMFDDLQRVRLAEDAGPTTRAVSVRAYSAPEAVASATPEEGDVVMGRFRLDQKVSHRAFTTVFKATQLSLDRPVAVKMLQPHFARQRERAERFCEEVRLVSRLASPHTINLVEFGESEGGLLFVVTEWLQGEPLTQTLRQGALTLAQVQAMTLDVLEALIEAHDQQVIHGDLKPSNVFLCTTVSRGVFGVLTDFAQARSFAGNVEDMVETLDGVLLGSPRYMAPEQLAPGRPRGAHTDLYALGLIMAEALTGKPVFSPKIRPVDVARAQLAPLRTPIPTSVLETPLGPIIDKATQKDTNLRYADARAMRDALLAVHIDAQPSAQPPPVPPPLPAAPAKPALIPAPQLHWAPQADDPSPAYIEVSESTIDVTDAARVVPPESAGPRHLWTRRLRGPLRGAVAVTHQGALVAGDADGVVRAFDLDGEPLWEVSTYGAITTTPQLGPSGVIVVGSHDERVYAIGPEGDVRWVFQADGAIQADPCISPDGVIYVGSDNRRVYALGPDGNLSWELGTWGALRGRMALSATGDLYAGCTGGLVYAITPHGQLRGRVQLGGALHGGVAVDAQCGVFAGAEDKTLYALDPRGSIQWVIETHELILGSPYVTPDGVIFGSGDGVVYALDELGLSRWTFTTGGPIQATPVQDADGVVYIGSHDRALYALDLDGDLLWSQTLDGRILAAATLAPHRRLLVTTDEGTLHAFALPGA